MAVEDEPDELKEKSQELQEIAINWSTFFEKKFVLATAMVRYEAGTITEFGDMSCRVRAIFKREKIQRAELVTGKH